MKLCKGDLVVAEWVRPVTVSLYFQLTGFSTCTKRGCEVPGRILFRARLYSTGLRAGHRDSRVRFPTGSGNFSLHHRVQNGSGAHQPPYPIGNGAVSLGVKRPGRETDHSPSSSAEVKEYLELCLHSPIRLHGVALIKNRDIFNFIFMFYSHVFSSLLFATSHKELWDF
jgi:hypothetical protein